MKQPKDPKRCFADTYERIGNWGSWHQCNRKWKAQSKDGNHYCTQHLPENVAAKRKAQEEEWGRKSRERERQWRIEALEKDTVRGLSESELQAVKQLGGLRKLIDDGIVKL